MVNAMNESASHRELVTLRDYVDIRFDSQDNAVKLALDALRENVRRNDKHTALVISSASFVVSLTTLVVVLVWGHL